MTSVELSRKAAFMFFITFDLFWFDATSNATENGNRNKGNT